MMLGCERFHNGFESFTLQCGEESPSPGPSLYFKALSKGEARDAHELELFRMQSDGQRSSRALDITSKGCVRMEQPNVGEILVLNQPSTDRPQGARFEVRAPDLLHNPHEVLPIELESYATRGFDVWSQCGSMRDAVDESSLVFKISNDLYPELLPSHFRVTVKDQSERRVLTPNAVGCIALPKNQLGLLQIEDERGLTYTEQVLNQDFSAGHPYPIYVQAVLSPQEACAKRGIEWTWQKEACVLKSFTELCTQNSASSEIEEPLRSLKETFHLDQCEELEKQLLDIPSLTTLERKGIKSLKILEPFSHFEIVKLNQNRIRDISPLSQMVNLKELYLQNNLITDVSELPTALQLKILGLWNNDVEDLKPLGRFLRLEELYLQNNQISDVGPLQHLNRLRLLYLSDNAIRDVQPLAQLPGMEELYLAYNRIEDVGPLGGLKSLKKLTLSFNQIQNIEALKSLVNMEVLYLWANKIEDLSPLAEMSKLQTLYISENKVRDISFLEKIHTLDLFYAPDNQITDIHLLAQQPKLRFVNLAHNPVSDISALKNLEYLIELKLEGTPLDLSQDLRADQCPLEARSAVVRDYCRSKVKH